MNEIQLSKNLVYMRKKRGITQEELATFLQVTKASVSKWENGLSMPDILTLPKLASYFDISIDELMGYQAQLSGKEIQKMYQQFSEAFAKEPFSEVREKIQEFVKEYYSCYSALLQIAVLYMNYYMIAGNQQEQKAVLEEAKEICQHIESCCANRDICEDAMIVRTMCSLALGEPKEVLQNLENYHDPKRLREQTDGILIQAYQMVGEQERANESCQYMIFKHLVLLIQDSFALLLLHMSDKEKGMQTIERLRRVVEAYDIEHLHPNTYLQYEYVCAQFFSLHGMEKEALRSLRKYANSCVKAVREGICIYGDSYFDKLGEYFQRCEIGTSPRDNKTILNSAAEALEHPLFAAIKDSVEFQKLREIFINEK